MPYQIINAETGRPIVRGGTPAMFPDGALANEYLSALRNTGDKRPLKIKLVNDPATDAAWQEREKQRMRTGHYVDVPFRAGIGPDEWWTSAQGQYSVQQLRDASASRYAAAIKAWGRAQHHYAHVSMADKSKLAYTENSEKGQRDIQTQIKPGAYLTKHFSDVLTHDQIAEIVRDWQRRYDAAELKFARTPEEIVRVYQTGPRSCMSGALTDYHSKSADVHPCAVYGLPHSDITMAYIANKGGISSRVLVWEAEKKHSRIYGDATLLSRELKALGYTNAPLCGAKIAKIPANRGKAFVMPYIDCTSIVTDEGDHFKLWDENQQAPRNKSRHDCRNTHGLSDSRNIITCSDCGDECDENDMYHVSGDNVCRSCIDDHYFICDVSGEYCDENNDSRNEVRVSRNSRLGTGWLTQTWCDRSVERYGFWCEATNAYYHTSHQIEAHDGTSFSVQALADGIYVRHGGFYYHKDDLPELES